MGFTKGSGGDWFTPQDGTYLGKFIGYEDGPTVTNKKDQRDGSVKEVQETLIRWKFELRTTAGVPVIDPKTNEIAIGEGLSSQTIGSNDESKAKARRWFRALYASMGQVFPGDKAPDEIANGAVGASAILQYAGGKLVEVSPAIGVAA